MKQKKVMHVSCRSKKLTKDVLCKKPGASVSRKRTGRSAKHSCATKVKAAPKTNTYTVAVVATMSAGKSTLLNAILGTKLLPSRKTACTSTMISIIDEDDAEDFKVRKVMGSRKGPWKTATREILTAYNDSGCSAIEIKGDVKGICNLASGPKTIKLKFVDTPGPNNAANRSHEAILQRALESTDYASIIFVLNATQLHTTDEASLLVALKKLVDTSHRPISVVFALNQMDAVLAGDDMPRGLPFVVEQTREYLVNSMGFESPTVIPIWATLALRCRAMLSGAVVDREDKEREVISDIERILGHATEIKLMQEGNARPRKSDGLQHDYYNAASGVGVKKETLAAAERLTGIVQLEAWTQKQMICNAKGAKK